VTPARTDNIVVPNRELPKRWPRFAAYLEAGKRQGIHEGYLASRRSPWYSQEKREPSPIVCTYIGRSLERPFRFILNRSKATAANVYHLFDPKAHIAQKLKEKTTEVLDALRAIAPEHFFHQGRVYGGGLYKIEPAEMMPMPADGVAEVLGARLERQPTLFQ
jgi:adenine-specific DNA-methyltransferase